MNQGNVMECASVEHKGFADANAMERAGKELMRLSDRARMLGNQVSMVYMIHNLTSCPEKVLVKQDFESSVNPHYLIKRAAEMREELTKELKAKEKPYAEACHAGAGGGNGNDMKPKSDMGCDGLVKNLKFHAQALSDAGSQVLSAVGDVRQDFVLEFFRRCKNLEEALNGAKK